MKASQILLLSVLGLGIFSQPADAKIFLDHEVEPLPLFDLTVILPVGFEARSAQESGLALTLADVFEAGTLKLNRQDFQDELGTYGASFDFRSSNQYSYLDLSFPLVEGQNYDGLLKLLAELWDSPRFDKETVDLAKLKLESTLQGSVDADGSLTGSVSRRWINKHIFHGFPVFLESLSNIKVDALKVLYDRDFKKVPDLWAGLIAPQSSKGLAEKFLTTIFKYQGAVSEGQHLKKLDSLNRAMAEVKKPPQRKLLIIDKAGRNQSITSLVILGSKELEPTRELDFKFGNYILTESGLGSVFNEAIRTKRGLAYAVQGQAESYLGYPSTGFSMNPVRERSAEAFEVSSDLVKSSFVAGKTFIEINDESWNRYWKSFRLTRILDKSSANGRLRERMDVVTGGMSPHFYQSNPDSWRFSRLAMKEFFSRLWKEGAAVLTVVGDAKELRPLLEKSFSDFEIQVLPYRDSIHASAY